MKECDMVGEQIERCMRVAAGLVLSASVVVAGCARNPVSGIPEVMMVSVEQEKKIGAEEAKNVEQQMGLLDDPAMTDYLDRMGQRLAKESPRQDVAYQFRVADQSDPNAFALPGGYIYVTRGLLALSNSEDELAGVVGHEIGHVAARHSVQKISKQGPFALVFGIASGLTGLVSPLVGNLIGGIGDFTQSIIFSPYSRSQETQADRIGQEMAAQGRPDRAGDGGASRLGPRRVIVVSRDARARSRTRDQRTGAPQFFRFPSGDPRPGREDSEACDGTEAGRTRADQPLA